MKSTPGPWKVSGSCVICERDCAIDERVICHITMPDAIGVSVPEGCANSRLIAAAPEMLEVIKNLLVPGGSDAMEWHDNAANARQAARELLARLEAAE